nr:interferon alpha/beta receptor 2 isoform X2 [Anas platyrhynchos]XP_038021896.1 interferon alpha/beta receptor 2 isoform X2 [Anas platyrhynchos]XP_038021897.1 interferon alpha/beta receptor 2 isoform X2 [Anas platyrhynchos]XP_038021900.1 interferon alpha/beta receptor 2 isoform X2 [Anas platyrhynchos]
METLMGGPLRFYQFAYIICILCAACCSSMPERFPEGPPFELKMESHNFEHILSWQAVTDPNVTAHYRVQYYDRRNWMIAQNCSYIEHLSCNLTEDFKNISSEYSVRVQSFVGTKVFTSSELRFVPHTDTWLGPPEVNISSCLSCINVTVKLPTPHLRNNEKLVSLFDIYEEIEYSITLKTPDREHKMPLETTTKETFSTVIRELHPNANYCVSVTVSASLNKHSTSSDWKCATAGSVAQQGYYSASFASAICFALVLGIVLKCMHWGGYILQKKSLPRTLVFIGGTIRYSPCTFVTEKTESVEIIYKEIKKKAVGSSVSDDSDSDDSGSDDLSNHDYTRRNIVRTPHSSDTTGVFVRCSTSSTCDDGSSQASEHLDDDPEVFEENEMDIEKDQDPGCKLLQPFPEENCTYSSRSRNNDCFTINLKSVLLGISEDTMDNSTALLSSQGDTVDWQHRHAFESQLPDDTESVQKPHCLNNSQEWKDSSSSSNESDSSDSDTDPKTEYLRR